MRDADGIRMAAATLIEERWREHRLAMRIEALHRVNAAREARRLVVAAEHEAREEQMARQRVLTGALQRVWPVMREVCVVMRCVRTQHVDPSLQLTLR